VREVAESEGVAAEDFEASVDGSAAVVAATVSESVPTQPCVAELHSAVVSGCWDRAAELCARVASADEGHRGLIAKVHRQIGLHREAARVVASGCAAPAPNIRRRRAEELDSPLAWLMRCSFAAIDGRRADAEAALRASIAANRPEPGAAISWCDGDSALHGEPPASPVQLIGLVRPSGRDEFTIGEAGSSHVKRVAAGGCPAPRGTPVQVTGRWHHDGQPFECASVAVLGEVPDYAAVCAAVTDLCALAGVATRTQCRPAPDSEIDPSVLQARARRREGESNLAFTAAVILEEALAGSKLSLDTLARVHALAVGPTCAHAGQLRIKPAGIRLRGVVTFRAPPVQEARSQTCSYLRDLSTELQAPESARHPAALSAEAVARLTSSHPFADGNGRVARAVAAWLLIRAGFRQRSSASLGVYLEARLDEQFSTLRNVQANPWGWHQLFYDAVLATFTR
jgi:fido (protein-threonine AMPylation protein)